MKIASLLAACAVCLCSFAALAEEAPAPAAPSPELKKRFEACKADAEKFCAAEIAARQNGSGERGAIGKCLDGHTADLSDGCKTARAERAAEKAKTGQ